MAIQIEQTVMQSVEQLTGKNQLLLTLIPEGQRWVQTMLADTTKVVPFLSEDGFIAQVVKGLHGTTLVNILGADLAIDIQKAAELDINQLLVLMSDSANGSHSGKVQQILSQNGLITNDQLNLISQVLDKAGLSLPYRWNATLADAINAYQRIAYVNQTMPQTNDVEATKYAFERAQTLTEFGDYYCLNALLLKANAKDAMAQDAIVSELTDCVLDNLDCPVVTHELDQVGLKNAVIQWQQTPSTLGFDSLTSGLVSIAANINLRDRQQLTTLAQQYIKSLQKQIADNLATDSDISQGGECRHYYFKLADRVITLNVDEAGCLSLYSDIPN